MPTFTRPHRRKLAKKSRTMPNSRCWNCRFICDKDRDELGDAESSAGDDHTDYHGIAKEDPYSDSASLICLLGKPEHFTVALEIGADGEPKTIRHDYTSDISRGCPKCGTTNWRGDF